MIKKLLWISGVASLLSLFFLWQGWAAAQADEILRWGNSLYASNDYSAALSAYEEGIELAGGSGRFQFNAAQAAYLLGDYEKAVQHYEKAEDTVEKYLNAGNVFFLAGEATEEDEQKVELYLQALAIYGEGIVRFPANVPLKYNYELVRSKLSAQSQNSEDGEPGEDSEEQEGQEGQEGEQTEGSQGENSSREEDGQDSASTEQSDPSAPSGEEENASQEGDEETDGDEDQQSASSGEDDKEEGDQNREALERILQMLQNQEEQSLKNNQEVKGGNEGENGW